MKSKRSKEQTFYTCNEVIDFFPQLKQNFGITSNDIGRLFVIGMLNGFSDKSRNRKLIDPDSVHLLIEFLNEVLEAKKINSMTRS